MCTCRIFGGLISDIKRKLPWYGSDFKDALHLQVLATTIFMYFACLTPNIMFGALLGTATDNNMVSAHKPSAELCPNNNQL